MKKLTRALAGMLAVILAAGTLTGCSLFGSKRKLPDKQTVNHVYKYEKKELYKITYPEQNGGGVIGVVDGSTATVDETEGTTTEDFYERVANENGYLFLVVQSDQNYNQTAFTLHYGKYDGSDEKIVQLPMPENKDEYMYYGNFARFEDGFAAIRQSSTLIDEKEGIYRQNAELVVYGEDGSLKGSFDLRTLLQIPDDKYISVNRVVACNGGVLLSYYKDAEITQLLNLDGTLGEEIRFLPDGVDGYVGDLFCVGSKLIAPVTTFSTDDSKQTIVTLDLATGERKETDAKNDYSITGSLFADANGNFYCSDSNGVYAVNLDTLEKTEILNYINSDYIYNYGSYSVLPDGRLISISDDYDDEKNTSTLNLSVFTKVPDEQLTPKYIITVASAGYAYNLQQQIVEFNLASEEYRIRYLDYTQYNTDDDYNAGQKKLGDDILAGNVPDVLIADSEFSVSKYISKGLFADLYTFIDKEEGMSRTDFLENILAGCEIDGKLYEIPTNFSIDGLLGRKDQLEAFRDLTIREFTDKVKTLPEGVSFFRAGDHETTRGNMLQKLFLINYENFIDRTTGKCGLNNDECRALLEYVKTLPEKSMWEDENFDSDNFDYDAYNNMYREGKAVAMTVQLGRFSALRDYSYSFGEDAALDFIGYPAPDRSGISFSTTNLKFLISAKGAFPDEAWNFVKIFLGDEYQSTQGWGFPVRKSTLDKMKQEMLDDIKKREEQNQNNGGGGDGDGIIAYDAVTSSIMPGGIYRRRDLTVEDVERVYAYVCSARKQLIYDTSLFDIINEEASAYFAGTKSLDEILPLMESRITIVLSEGR